MPRSALLPRALVVAAVFGGCVLQTDRTQDLGDGEIHGAVRHADDGKPAVGTVIQIAGSDRVISVDKTSASFVVKDLVPGTWLLHLVEDVDGDGAAERALWVPVTTKFVPIAKNLTDGCGGQPASAVTSVLLGNVDLLGTGHVTGTVRGLAVGDSARVVVWRDVDVGGSPHATPVEAGAGVAIDVALATGGTFDVAGVAPGDVHVAVFELSPVDGPNLAVAFGTADVTVKSGEDAVADVDVSEDARTTGDPTVLRTAPVQIDAQWNDPKTSAVTVSLVTFDAPDQASVLHAPTTDQFALDGNQRGFVVDAPIGVVDIGLESGSEGASGATLRHVVVIQGVAVLGPVELPVLADPCVTADDDTHDCDHDGIPGIAGSPDGSDATIVDFYAACAASCQDAFGTASAGATCDVDGSDCDDDGDGQPDVTEPPNCIGPGRGTDLDGDGECEPAQDPAPLCDEQNVVGPCDNTFTPPPARYP